MKVFLTPDLGMRWSCLQTCRRDLESEDATADAEQVTKNDGATRRTSTYVGNKLLFRVGEAAEALSLGRTKVYQLVASGQLRSVHVGRSVRIPGDALIDFAELLDASSERV